MSDAPATVPLMIEFPLEWLMQTEWPLGVDFILSNSVPTLRRWEITVRWGRLVRLRPLLLVSGRLVGDRVAFDLANPTFRLAPNPDPGELLEPAFAREVARATLWGTLGDFLSQPPWLPPWPFDSAWQRASEWAQGVADLLYAEQKESMAQLSMDLDESPVCLIEPCACLLPK